MLAAGYGALRYMISVPGESYSGELPPLTDQELALAARLKTHIAAIAAREHNIAHHDELEKVARYIETTLESYGYVVHRQNFAVDDKTVRNIDVIIEPRTGVRVANLVAPTWPIYRAGVDLDDEILQIDGRRVAGDGDVAAALQRHKPGDEVALVFKDRSGASKTSSVTLGEDPHIEVVVSEPTPAQQAFRDRWLASR